MQRVSKFLIISTMVIIVVAYGGFRLKESSVLVGSLKNEINILRDTLDEKDRQLLALEKTTKRAEFEVQDFKDRLIEATENIKELDEKIRLIDSEKVSLEKINLKIDNNLKDATSRLTQTQNSLELLKQKLSRINRQKILPLKSDVINLKRTLKNKNKELAILEKQLKDINEKRDNLSFANETLEGQISQLIKEGVTLKSELNDANEQLLQQNELISNLKSELDSVNDLLVKQEAEKDKLDSQLTQVNLVSEEKEEKLRKQEQYIKEIEIQNNNQKIKIAQLTDILTQKELELDNKQKESSSLNSEINSLQSRMESFKMELDAAKESQAKFIKYFGELTKLNAYLQDKLNELSVFVDEDKTDKNKAEKLKRRIEVILESIQVEQGRSETNDTEQITEDADN